MIKPYYDEGGVTIYHGDCRKLAHELRGGVDLLLTDPPYGLGYDTDYSRFGNERTYCAGKTYPPVRGDDEPFDPLPWLGFPKVVLFGANVYSERLPLGRWLVWDKRFQNGRAFCADAEAAWMGGRKNGNAAGVYIYSETTQGFVRSEPAQHPTQKPVGLMRWCIEKSRTHGTILDPYMGSGSTMVAAKQLGRRAIGIEIEKKYCRIAVERLRAMDAPRSIKAAA